MQNPPGPPRTLGNLPPQKGGSKTQLPYQGSRTGTVAKRDAGISVAEQAKRRGQIKAVTGMQKAQGY